ncbi:MAG TPA: curli-like amyloid fiber formation chaperone CsgH [Phenylobacterium sp.]
MPVPADFQALLDVTHQGGQVEIVARAAAAPPRLLRWRMVVQTQSGSGQSQTVQSGTSRGGPDPVARVRVNNPGDVVLEVSAEDGRKVSARREFRP